MRKKEKEHLNSWMLAIQKAYNNKLYELEIRIAKLEQRNQLEQMEKDR